MWDYQSDNDGCQKEKKGISKTSPAAADRAWRGARILPTSGSCRGSRLSGCQAVVGISGVDRAWGFMYTRGELVEMPGVEGCGHWVEIDKV